MLDAMSITDYLLDTVLVLLVFRQLRESRLNRRAVLLPVIICAVVAEEYLHSVPTSGGNLALVAVLTVVGLTLGIASGLTTRVRSDATGTAWGKAGGAAALLWVLGMGSRFGFSVWVSHGGGPAVGRFSAAHGLTAAGWTAALVLMALAEVLSRTGLLVYRARRVVDAERADQHRLLSV
jgi:hypothetical protein